MSYDESDLLRSEIGTLEGILAELSEDDLVERAGLTNRLMEARKRLDRIVNEPRSRPLSLTFRGAPVDESRSIDASFAGKAIKAFVDAAATVTASFMTDLGDRGRLPSAKERSLRIIDKATGSFGFTLLLPPPPEGMQPILFPDEQDDPHGAAIVTTMKLLERAAAEDEDALSDLIAEIHPRAAIKVREFAQVLEEHDALLAISFEDQHMSLDDGARVRRVIQALRESDISETSEHHDGTILGILPESRRFEARLESGEILHGKMSHQISDLREFKTRWEEERARLQLSVIRVRSRRRYVLLGASPPRSPGGSST